MTDAERAELRYKASTNPTMWSGSVLALLDERDRLAAEVTRLRAAMTSAIIDLQRGYHATAAAILRVALEPKS